MASLTRLPVFASFCGVDQEGGTNAQGSPGIEIPGYCVKALRAERARPLCPLLWGRAEIRSPRWDEQNHEAGPNVQTPPGIEIPGYFVKALRAERALSRSQRHRVRPIDSTVLPSIARTCTILGNWWGGANWT